VEVAAFTVTSQDEIGRERHERYREHGTILDSVNQQLELEDGEISDRDFNFVVHCYALRAFGISTGTCFFNI
jgi:hypothetical protein